MRHRRMERAATLAILAAVVGALSIACEETPEPEPQPSPFLPAPEATDPAPARDAAQALGRALKTRLLAAMAEGPRAAVEACANEAQAITARVGEEHGARVGRSSLRLRNPANAGPAWVTEWLEAQGERPAEGVTPLATAGGWRARFIGPIAIEGPCLACHGPEEGIAPDVRALLDERYPGDRARGYALGDLRGAIWAEVDLR